MWSFLKLSMMMSTTLVPSLRVGWLPLTLRMRSVRSHPAPPSRVAPASPAPVSFRKSLRENRRCVRCFTKREVTTRGYHLQARLARPRESPYLNTHDDCYNHP